MLPELHNSFPESLRTLFYVSGGLVFIFPAGRVLVQIVIE